MNEKRGFLIVPYLLFLPMCCCCISNIHDRLRGEVDCGHGHTNERQAAAGRLADDHTRVVAADKHTLDADHIRDHRIAEQAVVRNILDNDLDVPASFDHRAGGTLLVVRTNLGETELVRCTDLDTCHGDAGLDEDHTILADGHRNQDDTLNHLDACRTLNHLDDPVLRRPDADRTLSHGDDHRDAGHSWRGGLQRNHHGAKCCVADVLPTTVTKL